MWSSWTFQGQCSETCEPGTLRAIRTCDNPPPHAFSEECLFLDGQTRGLEEVDPAHPCNLGSCEGEELEKELRRVSFMGNRTKCKKC